MPPTRKVTLAVDDNSPAGAPAFTSEPSTRSFAGDFNLGTRTAAEVFLAVHDRIGRGELRGYPSRASEVTRGLLSGFVGSDEVTWVSAAELAGDRP